MEFVKIKEDEFDFIFSQMQSNFILEERRDYLPAKNILQNKDYELFHLQNESKKVGFISVWHLDGMEFIEHFVVYEEYRNSGLGAKALNLAKEKWENLVLEAELPLTEIAKRRLGFYQRNGFIKNREEYYQPPYRKGGEGVFLALLSYPTQISDFEKVKTKIYKRVYGV
ncbi:MAG: GNAT family N-acetyltransferase [Clostridia bacterium]|nr:GNAT family N-acetyltransferase [Clostridia bacterium]